MHISLRSIAKSKRVSISGLLAILGIFWKGINVLSNVEFVIQKRGALSDLINFLLSSRGADIILLLTLLAFVLSVLIEVNRGESTTIPKVAQERPSTTQPKSGPKALAVTPQSRDATRLIVSRLREYEIEGRRLLENSLNNSSFNVSTFHRWEEEVETYMRKNISEPAANESSPMTPSSAIRIR
jgi:hypothetical protein